MGRTARAGEPGAAVSFMSAATQPHWSQPPQPTTEVRTIEGRRKSVCEAPFASKRACKTADDESNGVCQSTSTRRSLIEQRHLGAPLNAEVAEAPWSVAEWAVALLDLTNRERMY